MSNFSKEILEEVNNAHGFVFYKLLINNVCLFDSFVAKLKSLQREKKSLNSIFAYMDMFSRQQLPKSKFRAIKNSKRKDVFEFKKDNIRVYIILQENDVYVVAGGFKHNQDKDVKRIIKLVQGF